MPEESSQHEATWLQWPHQHQYGVEFRDRLDKTWIDFTKALIQSEKVKIVAYDDLEKQRITQLLNPEKLDWSKIEIVIHPTDDVWVRDNGPIYVKDKTGKMVIEDWGFNGWGGKTNYHNCDVIPTFVGQHQSTEVIDLNETLTNEGGAIEIDGNGTLLATKSAVLNENRNKGMSQEEAEEVFTKYLGVTHFIWLKGKPGLEITDMHIDGFARFGNQNTIVTMNENDLLEWQVSDDDIKLLFEAKNKNGMEYKFVKLPLTKNDVSTTYGKKLNYKGSYVNYYIANSVVLVPNYNDENDIEANSIIQKLYPTRKVIGIDVRNLYANGGMIHCVTQQQPK
jgi:agmatine deiminase